MTGKYKHDIRQPRLSGRIVQEHWEKWLNQIKRGQERPNWMKYINAVYVEEVIRPGKRFQVDFETEFLTEHHDENDCEKIICQVPCFNLGGFLLNIFRLIRRLLDRRQCDQMLKKQPFLHKQSHCSSTYKVMFFKIAP